MKHMALESSRTTLTPHRGIAPEVVGQLLPLVHYVLYSQNLGGSRINAYINIYM